MGSTSKLQIVEAWLLWPFKWTRLQLEHEASGLQLLLLRLALGIYYDFDSFLPFFNPCLPRCAIDEVPPESSFLVVFALFRVLQRQAGQAPSKNWQAGDAHFSGQTTGLLPRDDCAFPQTLSRCFFVSREVLWVHKIHRKISADFSEVLCIFYLF